MNDLLNAFLNNLLPIFLATGIGFLLGKKTSINPGSLSKIVLYIFSPCLIFAMLTGNSLSSGDVLTMMGYTIVLMVIVAAITGGIGFFLKWERSIVAATILASIATNAGNYGLSLTRFAFGDKALPYATLFMVANSLMTYTLGISIASWGSARKENPLKAPFQYPFLYAFILAMIFNYFHLRLPLPVDRVVTMFSDASIPSMLVLLGVQMSAVDWAKPSQVLVTTNLMRLVASPTVAIALSAIFALQGPARQAGIIQAAMPTAVTAMLLATEFDLQPGFVTISVAFSTLLSFVTLTPLITYLS
ncbi:MAG: AEC family transporter [Chloroflexi bacterium]|nr:AEC family transporter [Chloroflexota bacterium]